MTHEDKSTVLGIETGFHEHPILPALCSLPFPLPVWACATIRNHLVWLV